MTDEGYAAVSSRSVAARVGINAGLVHYYFSTLDDLFVAVLTRGADRNLERLARALASPEPLVELWRLNSNRAGVVLLNELLAAANHRPALRDSIVDQAQAIRRVQLEAIRQMLPGYSLDPDEYPPELVAATIQGLALLLAREEALGISTDHEIAERAFESILQGLEARRTNAEPGRHVGTNAEVPGELDVS